MPRSISTRRPHYILGHDGVWNTTADDIAEYYIANYYDQVSSWIAEHKAPV
jgi:hypothetical protein